jgi:predicted GNAT family acetyltransferase
MRIEIEETESKGRYVMVDEDGVRGAEMSYSRAGASLLIIDHTEVSDAWRGSGAGAQLVARAVEDARASGRRILPLCPFARSQFDRHPEWRDVLSR